MHYKRLLGALRVRIKFPISLDNVFNYIYSITFPRNKRVQNSFLNWILPKSKWKSAYVQTVHNVGSGQDKYYKLECNFLLLNMRNISDSEY